MCECGDEPVLHRELLALLLLLLQGVKAFGLMLPVPFVFLLDEQSHQEERDEVHTFIRLSCSPMSLAHSEPEPHTELGDKAQHDTCLDVCYLGRNI